MSSLCCAHKIISFFFHSHFYARSDWAKPCSRYMVSPTFMRTFMRGDSFIQSRPVPFSFCRAPKIIFFTFFNYSAPSISARPFQFILSFCTAHSPPMQSHTIKCDLNALKDGPLDIKNINLFAGAPAAPPTMLIYLGLKSLPKTMVSKISAARYLRTGPTAETVKRPKLGFNSVARRIIKSSQHSISRQPLALERWV
jgi:hypothetical protein